ncbi:hypothetical protein J2T02_004856 [Chitinophaga terrae (ex Kim and Jung 2007)]|uniref:hypothetical protein n=1 Tax=Chitinophaga terrae (ex Kim and Jung 2007) TaxID=408074 RepID=UPI0027880A28|nr:hypothetical protein [Chitinophaga terrae (ex Kim and Jung 2007)]MDQ0109712.1 hypothetical protein [Chitinophaga terrae (ex Kim and Jung 2007)]
MPAEKKKKVSLKEILKGIWFGVVALFFILLHTLQWLFCESTFLPKIWPLLLFLLAGIPLAWWAARKCRTWLTRLFDGIDSRVLHIGTMLLLVSWIPPALLLSTNYLLAGKTVVKETLPVISRGDSYSRYRKYYWVKIKKDGATRKLTLNNGMAVEDVDSVEIEIRRGGLGFNYFEHPRFVLHAGR